MGEDEGREPIRTGEEEEKDEMKSMEGVCVCKRERLKEEEKKKERDEDTSPPIRTEERRDWISLTPKIPPDPNRTVP